MYVLKMYLIILGFLVIGFFLTENVLRVIYENFGISFTGNVWVNWFGVSYLLYFLYTIIHRLFINTQFLILIADEKAKSHSAPLWNELDRMSESSFPKIGFQINEKMNQLKIECAFNKTDFRIPEYDCPYDTKGKRRSMRLMKTHTPLSVAMKVFDDPSDYNNQLSCYVKCMLRPKIIKIGRDLFRGFFNESRKPSSVNNTSSCPLTIHVLVLRHGTNNVGCQEYVPIPTRVNRGLFILSV